MKQLIYLYQSNGLFAFICDTIALLTGTTVLVFIIAVLTVAFAV